MTAEEIDEDRLYRKVIGRIVPLFSLGFVFSYLDPVDISLAERIGHPREIATAAALIAAIGMFAAWLLADHLALALAGLSVSVAGVLALMPLYWTLPGRLLAGPAAAGGLALINSFGSFSGVLGVWVLGLAGISLASRYSPACCWPAPFCSTLLLMTGRAWEAPCSQPRPNRNATKENPHHARSRPARTRQDRRRNLGHA